MGSTLFRDPHAQSSTLTVLRTLQNWAIGSLNHVDPSDLVSNYYVHQYTNTSSHQPEHNDNNVNASTAFYHIPGDLARQTRDQLNQLT